MKKAEKIGEEAKLPDGTTLRVNYSEAAKKDKLIMFVPNKKKNNFVISADDLLDLISKKIDGQGIAVHLRDIERNQIWMVETVRHFQFAADKDYAKGETISVEASIPTPALLYAAEKAYNLCKLGEDKTFKAVSVEDVTEQMQDLVEKNKSFVDHLYRLNKADNDNLNKKTPAGA